MHRPLAADSNEEVTRVLVFFKKGRGPCLQALGFLHFFQKAPQAKRKKKEKTASEQKGENSKAGRRQGGVVGLQSRPARRVPKPLRGKTLPYGKKDKRPAVSAAIRRMKAGRRQQGVVGLLSRPARRSAIARAW